MSKANNKKTGQLSDTDILQHLRDRLFDAIKDTTKKTKVGDLLKVIELKRKLSVTGKSERAFWDMINDLRKKELPGARGSNSKRKSKKAGV